MAERAPTRAQLLAQLEDRDRRLEEAAEQALVKRGGKDIEPFTAGGYLPHGIRRAWRT